MDKKIIQVSIRELTLDKRGPIDGAEDINMFRFTMSYPAEGISGIETVKTVRANKPIPNNWADDFEKSIVFKTPIRGTTILKVEALCVDKDSKAEKFFKGLFKGIFGAVLGVWTGAFGSAYVGAITKTIGNSFIDLVEDDDDIDLIGEATFKLSSESLDEVIESNLVVKKPVVEKVYVRTGPRSNTRRRRVEDRVVIEAGSNGAISLNIEVI